ncbi:MAG: hypothetical protein QFX36_01455 [Archaeoglobales archaeon]|nr:hypothetical protein [Archaeoglobales archaeon]
MLEQIKKIVEGCSADPSVVACAVYKVDGTPIVTNIKGKEYLSILQWLEDLVKILLRQIFEGSLRNVEFRMLDYSMLIFPLSRSLALIIVCTSDASLYKLKIDVESFRGRLNV